MAVNFKASNIEKNRDLIDAVKKTLTVENEAIKEKVSHQAYEENLPEGVTMDQVKKLTKYHNKLIPAYHVAVGEMAADIFLEKPSCNVVPASIGFFGENDTVDIEVSRKKTFTNQWAEKEEDKKVDKYLCMKTNVTIQSSHGHGVKSLRDAMSKEFEDMFKK